MPPLAACREGGRRQLPDRADLRKFIRVQRLLLLYLS